MSEKDEVSTALSDIARQLSYLSFEAPGGQHPGGLEGLSMALAGQGMSEPVGPALNRIADALESIAEAITDSKD